MRRASTILLLSVLPAIVAGALWFAWLGHGCTQTHSGLASFAFAAFVIGGTVFVVDRLHAWQTHGSRSSLGVDIVAFWLVVTCIVLVTLIHGGAHHCFE